MDQSVIYYVVIVLCLVLLCFLSPGFRRFVFSILFGPPNLRVEELPDIFDGSRDFDITRNPQKKLPGADRSIQFHDGRVSVIYHTTRIERDFMETVDIAYIGKTGMIFTLQNGKLTSFERVGDGISNDPQLTRGQLRALDQFMLRLRKQTKKVSLQI